MGWNCSQNNLATRATCYPLCVWMVCVSWTESDLFASCALLSLISALFDDDAFGLPYAICREKTVG